MGNTRKKAFDIDGFSEKKKETILEADGEGIVQTRGIYNDQLAEPIPNFEEAPCEVVHSGKNNTWLVFGRDRPSGLKSGYGGQGHTQAGSIDIVVGRDAPSPTLQDKDGNKRLVQPDFFKDAARIHISQKTDVDDNFKLADGNVGNSKRRSAIGLKADAVRIIARDGGIKLTTRTDRQNSQGADVKAIHGIELNAGNQKEGVQPMVKGENLAAALKDLSEQVSKLTGIVDNILTSQMIINSALLGHVHICAAPGSPTTPSAEVASAVGLQASNLISNGKVALVNEKLNLALWLWNYLSPAGKKYINSLYNTVN